MTAPSVLLGRFVPQPAESYVLPSTSILRPSPQAAQAVIRAPRALGNGHKCLFSGS